MNYNKRGQAAMEFLMTYGWAILVVLAAVGALAYFGVLSPDTLLPERTTFQAPLANVDNAFADADTGEIEVSFTNNVGQTISFTGNGSLTWSEENTDCDLTAIVDDEDNDLYATGTLSNGGVFRATWTCPGNGGDVGERLTADNAQFEYTNENTGSTRRHSGQIQARWS